MKKLHILPTVLFCFMLATGCGNKPASTVELMPTAEDTGNKGEADFPAFWTVFRNAVMENKMDEIKKRTRFPLQTKGVMDSEVDEMTEYSQNEFDEMFNLFLQMPTGLNPDNFNETHQEYITKHPQIVFEEFKNPHMSGQKDMATIASMLFHKNKGKWELTLLYLDEDIYAKTGKQVLSNK
jgi:hypothetical protein